MAASPEADVKAEATEAESVNAETLEADIPIKPKADPSAYFKAGSIIDCVHTNVIASEKYPVNLRVKLDDDLPFELYRGTKFYIDSTAYVKGSTPFYRADSEVSAGLPLGTSVLRNKGDWQYVRRLEGKTTVKIADNTAFWLQAGMRICQMSNGLVTTLESDVKAELATEQVNLDVTYQRKPIHALIVAIIGSFLMMMFYSKSEIAVLYPVFFSAITMLTCITQFVLYLIQQKFRSAIRWPNYFVHANRWIAWLSLALCGYWVIFLCFVVTGKYERPILATMQLFYCLSLVLPAGDELDQKRKC